MIPPQSFPEDISTLSTTYTPDCLETRSIRSRVALKVAIETDYLEKGYLPSITDQALSRREALINPNIMAEALSAPVYRLPIELLQEILTYTIPPALSFRYDALDSNLHLRNSGDTSPQHIRLVLRQVCRLWDIVVRNTPRIWSTLSIVDERQTRGFENGLIYSRIQPLDIYIGKWGCSPFIIEHLGREIGRIRQLILDSPQIELMRLLNTDKFDYAPHLEYLAWSWVKVTSDDSTRFIMGKVGLNAPNLKFMTLVDSPVSLRSFHAASLRGLRRLHVISPLDRGASSTVYLDILSRCPSLEELVVHNMYAGRDSFFHHGVKVPLLFLKSLTVLHSNDDDTILFLQDINSPNLEELSLSLCTLPLDDEGHWPIDPGLRSLLTVAQTSLRTLKLEHLCLRGADNQPLLSLFFNLRDLEIKECIIGNAILSDLTPESASAAMPCPELSSLTFDDVKLSGDELFRLVRNRTSFHTTQAYPHCPIAIKNFRNNMEHYHYEEFLKLSCSRNITLQVRDNPLLSMPGSPTTPEWDNWADWKMFTTQNTT